jgi:leader peptidase (prepilin peptidase) / N-methyltransferase
VRDDNGRVMVLWGVAAAALGGLVAGTGGRAVVSRYVPNGSAAHASVLDARGDRAGTEEPASKEYTPEEFASEEFASEAYAATESTFGESNGQDVAVGGGAAGGRPRPWLARLAVPAATGALCGGLAASVGRVPVLAALCWLAACGVPLAVIDARIRRLPDPLTAAAYVGTVALLAVAAGSDGHWGTLGRAVGGGAALAGCLLALALIGPNAVGLGDVKLAASAGTALAWYGWGALLAGAFAGLLLAACYGLVLLALRRATLRAQIPYGPFLLAGTFAAVIAAATVA